MHSQPNIKWFQICLSQWFKTNKRQFPWRGESSSKYELAIAEVLLQRTNAATVSKFYKPFIKNFPSWIALATAEMAELQVFLRPIGLWRQRAIAIKNLAVEMAERNGRFPKGREKIERLPGVGQYIASAILLLCWNRREPLLDVNMARVLERFFGPRKLADIRYDPYLQKLARDVLPRKGYREFNWAMLDFASMVCKARKPMCATCCLNERCLYFKQYRAKPRREKVRRPTVRLTSSNSDCHRIGMCRM